MAIVAHIVNSDAGIHLAIPPSCLRMSYTGTRHVLKAKGIRSSTAYDKCTKNKSVSLYTHKHARAGCEV